MIINFRRGLITVVALFLLIFISGKCHAHTNDLEILYRICESESTGEGYVGKQLVCEVIMNRVADDRFPDTIEDVVFNKIGNTWEFSPLYDGRYYSVEITQETIDAVNEIMYNGIRNKNILFFQNKDLTGSWADKNAKYLFTHNNHKFYTK